MRRFDPDERRLERLGQLGDGVYAFAFTLLALEVRPPENWDGQLGSLAGALWAPVAAFVLSVALLGGLWWQQRGALALIRRVDGLGAGLWVMHLMLVAIAPASIAMQMRFARYEASFAVYAGVLGLISFAGAAFWIYTAVFRGFTAEGLSRRYRIWHGVTLLSTSLWALMTAIATAMGVLGGRNPPYVWLGLGLALMVTAMGARLRSRQLPPQDVVYARSPSTPEA